MNKDVFAKEYAIAFEDSYPNLPIQQSKPLIEKALAVALKDIRSVNINGKAFKLTCKKLGIKHTYKAIEEFLNQPEVKS